jgi:hypothetical protein
MSAKMLNGLSLALIDPETPIPLPDPEHVALTAHDDGSIKATFSNGSVVRLDNG